MAAGRARRGAGTVGRVTKTAGMNRFVWDVRNQSGLAVPPGGYQARLKAGGAPITQPFNVLIDPNVAVDGTTAADLKEQYEHNTRARQLVDDVGQIVTRVREAQTRIRGIGDTEKLKQLDAIAARLMTEPVRYGKPGLQAHITYLAGMTSRGDQKVGRDALERYEALRKELDAIKAELDRVAGAAGLL